MSGEGFLLNEKVGSGRSFHLPPGRVTNCPPEMKQMPNGEWEPRAGESSGRPIEPVRSSLADARNERRDALECCVFIANCLK